MRPYKHGEGQWWGTRWMPALPLAPDDEREMPRTYPDEACASHVAGCLCDVCKPLPAELKRKLRRAARGHSRYQG